MPGIETVAWRRRCMLNRERGPEPRRRRGPHAGGAEMARLVAWQCRPKACDETELETGGAGIAWPSVWPERRRSRDAWVNAVCRGQRRGPHDVGPETAQPVAWQCRPKACDEAGPETALRCPEPRRRREGFLLSPIGKH